MSDLKSTWMYLTWSVNTHWDSKFVLSLDIFLNKTTDLSPCNNALNWYVKPCPGLQRNISENVPSTAPHWAMIQVGGHPDH